MSKVRGRMNCLKGAGRRSAALGEEGEKNQKKKKRERRWQEDFREGYSKSDIG